MRWLVGLITGTECWNSTVTRRAGLNINGLILIALDPVRDLGRPILVSRDLSPHYIPVSAVL